MAARSCRADVTGLPGMPSAGSASRTTIPRGPLCSSGTIGASTYRALYVFDPLANCSALVAKAYQAADLNLINKQVLNLVTPEDLDPES